MNSRNKFPFPGYESLPSASPLTSSASLIWSTTGGWAGRPRHLPVRDSTRIASTLVAVSGSFPLIPPLRRVAYSESAMWLQASLSSFYAPFHSFSIFHDSPQFINWVAGCFNADMELFYLLDPPAPSTGCFGLSLGGLNA